MKKTLLWLLALVMVMSMLVGCGGNAPAEPAEPAEEGSAEAPAATGDFEPAREDGVMDVTVASEPETIDPALNSAVDGAIILQHSFEGLIRWVNDGNGVAELAPGVAESWDVSEDGTEWTFHIREDAKWSDGEPVTANDFVYAWNRLVDPATGADYEYMLDMVKGYDEKELAIEAVDPATFKVTLSGFCPYFEEICAFPATFPVREDIVADNEQWTQSPETYIGNGPYVMEEWMHNSKITFVKNENYHNVDNVKCDKIVFHLMDDENSILAGYRSGELDFVEKAPSEEIPGLLASGEMVLDPYIGTYFVCFNTQKAPFDDARVREAFSLVIDRDFIANTVTASGEVPAGGFVPAGINDAEGNPDFRTVGGDYYSVDPADYEANCEKARELLKEAGYENGEGFPLVEYLYNTNENHKAIGEALQNMWQNELGVTVSLENQDWNVFLTERKAGNFSIARHGWIADYNDPMTFVDMWMTGGGNNDAQYNNPEFDKLVKAAKEEQDPAKRMELMHEAEDMAVGEDWIVAPLYFYTNKRMMKPNIEGIYYTPLGYYMFDQATGF